MSPLAKILWLAAIMAVPEMFYTARRWLKARRDRG